MILNLIDTAVVNDYYIGNKTLAVVKVLLGDGCKIISLGIGCEFQ